MNLTSRQNKDFWVLDISGRIDRINDAVVLKDEVDRILSEKHADIAFNLDSVSYLDSGALNVIITVRNRLERENAQLILLSPNEYVRDVIDVVGLSKVIPIYNSEKEFEDAR